MRTVWACSWCDQRFLVEKSCEEHERDCRTQCLAQLAADLNRTLEGMDAVDRVDFFAVLRINWDFESGTRK